MAFINCKRSVKIPTKKGIFSYPASYLGIAPDHLKEHWYFKNLCKDGTITFCESSKDGDVEIAQNISADKEWEAEIRAERQRRIDEAKEAAKAEAERIAIEEGLDATAAKKLIKDMQREAAQTVIDGFKQTE